LQGVLADPIDIGPLPDAVVPQVVARRVEVFKMSENVNVPVDERGFNHVYRIMHGNLRNALGHCQDFTLWMTQAGPVPETADEKFALLEVWLAELADKYEGDTRGMTPRGWEVFDALVERGGTCSPSDYEEFGFESGQAMQPHLRRLHDANLVVSNIDETDRRRKTIGVTPRGWLINYKRTGFRSAE
jgi:DNA-binding MarR family transcriptional regulator